MDSNSLRILKADTEQVMSADLPWELLDGARVVVSGAAGFLGGALVRSLLALHPAGHIRNPLEVVALVRNLERSRLRLADVADDPQLEWLSWDLNQLGTPQLGCPHFIIHAASQASPRFFIRDPVGTLLPNTVGTAALLHAAQGARRFLFVSSTEVYGSVLTDEALLEDDFGVLDPTGRRACYAESKRLGEALCTAWHAQHGLETIIVRLFHTYGTGLLPDDGRIFSDFAYAIARGEPMVMTSDGSARRTFCYISDATAGLLTVLLKGTAGQAYNLPPRY